MSELTPWAEAPSASDGRHGAPTAPHGHTATIPEWPHTEPTAVPAIAESVEVVIEHLDAPLAAAPVMVDGLAAVAVGRDDSWYWAEARAAAVRLHEGTQQQRDAPPALEQGAALRAAPAESSAISIDEYAKAVLYNGLGHYQAARAAAARACHRDDFVLLQAALGELVEASVRSGDRDGGAVALRRLEARAATSGSGWALGVAAASRALLSDDDVAEAHYRTAIEHLRGTRASVALARAHLLYGEWLRRVGRRVDARDQLARAHRVFIEVGLDGFAERTRREFLASGETARKRSDDTRLDLTPQEHEIARLAAGGCTNPEIGERLFISPRTVEWHLRKVFVKLGVTSRRELRAIFGVGSTSGR